MEAARIILYLFVINLGIVSLPRTIEEYRKERNKIQILKIMARVLMIVAGVILLIVRIAERII